MKIAMKIAMACLVGLVLSVGTVWAEPVVEGRVRLASGEAAVGAQVLVFDLADMSRWVGATTDASGHFVLSLGALASGQALPEGFGLGQNYPNPFNPGTVIPYQLAADGYVRLEVFNLLGQRVVTLVEGEMGAGRYTAAWDGRDASGQGVAAGVYIYRLLAGGGTQTRRMVLVDGAVGTGAGGAGAPAALSAPVGDGGAVYGLTVSGVGVETYVDAAFRVGVGPVVVVAEEGAARGKAVAGGILGDVNNDGEVNVSDALLVTLYSGDSSMAMPNGGDISLGDVNGDGAVDATDAYLITLYSVDPNDPALPAGIGEPVVLAGILGDVNGDGLVDAADALLVTLYSGDSSTVIPSGGDISLGDVNGDGVVDATDAYLITLYSVDPNDPALPVGIGEPVVEPSDDRAVLVAFYEATGGANWQDNTNWLSEEPLYKWYGVTTDEEGRVFRLDLSRNGLSGSLPVELGQLHNLAWLDLSDNDLWGSLPLAWGQLHNLAWLDLSDNDLTGSLPLAWGQLHNLRELRLYDNDLTGSLPLEWGQLHNLRELNLYNNGLTGSLPVELGQLHNLIYLSLGWNDLWGSLPLAWGQLHNLRELDLSENDLTGSLPLAWGQLHNLRELDLSDNDLWGSLPLAWGQLHNLERLDLGGNELTGCIPSMLRYIKNDDHDLDALGLSFCNISPDDAGDRAVLVAFYEATGGANWQDNTNWLSEEPLYEWYGVTTDEEGRVFRLDLSRNGLSGSLPVELGDLRNLRMLDLSRNGLSGSLPVELGDLHNLRMLDLSRNGLSGSLPVELGQLHNLRELDLCCNDLMGSLPVELGQLHNLIYLDLRGNGLSGSLPVELGQLHNLIYLSLGWNDLWGSLPLAWGQLHNLGVLSLRDNHLTGSLPLAWGQLHNLITLDLGFNDLWGSLPSEWGQLRNLEWLSLRDNHLTGSLPLAWGQLHNLEWLSLGGNELTGCIPRVLQYIRKYDDQDLDDLGLSFCQ